MVNHVELSRVLCGQDVWIYEHYSMPYLSRTLMPRARLLFCLLPAVVLGLAAQAAPVAQDAGLAAQRGLPLHQKFRPDGSSVITSADARVCVVSRRIQIETSTYQAVDGALVPFDQITRSPAASVQAVVDKDTAPGFRIQLKYSPTLAEPITLRVGAQVFDLRSVMEPSTDSLWISGDVARVVEVAFRAGQTVELVAVSGDTARHVTDQLTPPDMTALDLCKAALTEKVAGDTLVTNEVRISFEADPETTPLATLPDLRTCGMTDAPGELHLARLTSVTGFFAQTDKIFVSFDAAGAVAQAYIPGIFEADFRNGAHQIRISRAANSNLPMAVNAVKGCLGAEAETLCSYHDGKGHLLASCMDGSGDGLGTPLAGLPGRGRPTVGDLIPNPQDGGGGGTPLGTGTLVGAVGGNTDTNPDPDPAPSPVPLPATGVLLVGAAGLLAALRRRKA